MNADGARLPLICHNILQVLIHPIYLCNRPPLYRGALSDHWSNINEIDFGAPSIVSFWLWVIEAEMERDGVNADASLLFMWRWCAVFVVVPRAAVWRTCQFLFCGAAIPENVQVRSVWYSYDR